MDKLDIVQENEKEWRTYLIKRLDKLEENQNVMDKDFNVFKIKAYFFLGFLSCALELVRYKFLGR